MTRNAPTWGDVEDFLAADGWRAVPASARGGRRQRHVFYEKTLADGRVLQTHVSHARGKTISPGRFGTLLRQQLEVSKEEFWDCIARGEPVHRPVPLDEPEATQHDAYVIAVLAGDLHMSAEQIAHLSRDEAVRLVNEHWSQPR